MKSLSAWLLTIAGAALLAPEACAQYPAPYAPPPAPAAGYRPYPAPVYSTSYYGGGCGSCGQCNGRPPAQCNDWPPAGSEPFNGILPPWSEGNCNSGRRGGRFFGRQNQGEGQVPTTAAFPTHPFARSPRDYFMFDQ